MRQILLILFLYLFHILRKFHHDFFSLNSFLFFFRKLFLLLTFLLLNHNWFFPRHFHSESIEVDSGFARGFRLFTESAHLGRSQTPRSLVFLLVVVFPHKFQLLLAFINKRSLGALQILSFLLRRGLHLLQRLCLDLLSFLLSFLFVDLGRFLLKGLRIQFAQLRRRLALFLSSTRY